MSNSTIQRRREIMDYLQDENFCSINTLIEHFNVAPATLRRDMTILEKDGLVQRTHGSVRLVTPSPVPDFSERRTIYPEEKSRISRCAAKLVHDGDTILLDGGTSTLGILPHIRERQNITLITNSIAAVSMCPPTLTNVTILGGQLDASNLSTYGPYAEQMLDQFSASILFISTTGIYGTEGMTTHSPYQASIKRKMIQRSQKRVLLVDSHKFKQAGTFRFATFSDIDILITSEPIQDLTLRQHLDLLGIETLVAEK